MTSCALAAIDLTAETIGTLWNVSCRYFATAKNVFVEELFSVTIQSMLLLTIQCKII
jgi:hypothetical protein